MKGEKRLTRKQKIAKGGKVPLSNYAKKQEARRQAATDAGLHAGATWAEIEEAEQYIFDLKDGINARKN